jgi:hypothetical protein
MREWGSAGEKCANAVFLNRLTVLSRINFLEKNLQHELQPLFIEAEELLKLFTTINKKSKAAK